MEPRGHSQEALAEPDLVQAPSEPCPFFVQLAGEPVVVVGGGQVAERKVETLLEHGASITVVAPELTGALEGLAQDQKISWIARTYQQGDLDDALLTICATDDPIVNREVYAEASAKHRLVNVVDVPELCNTIVPSVLKRGRLQIAVSTGGASPSAARDIRRSLEASFPECWARYLDLMAELRAMIKARVPGPMELRAPLYEHLQASDLFDRVAAGQDVDAEEEYRRLAAEFQLNKTAGSAAVSNAGGMR